MRAGRRAGSGGDTSTPDRPERGAEGKTNGVGKPGSMVLPVTRTGNGRFVRRSRKHRSRVLDSGNRSLEQAARPCSGSIDHRLM